MAMMSPVFQILAFAQENISEWGVSAVARTGQHQELSVHLAWEQNSIPVKRQEWIFNPNKGLEIGGLCHADGCTVSILTPDNIIGIFHLD